MRLSDLTFLRVGFVKKACTEYDYVVPITKEQEQWLIQCVRQDNDLPEGEVDIEYIPAQIRIKKYHQNEA